jgi:hypothetical protein
MNKIWKWIFEKKVNNAVVIDPTKVNMNTPPNQNEMSIGTYQKMIADGVWNTHRMVKSFIFLVMILFIFILIGMWMQVIYKPVNIVSDKVPQKVAVDSKNIQLTVKYSPEITRVKYWQMMSHDMIDHQLADRILNVYLVNIQYQLNKHRDSDYYSFDQVADAWEKYVTIVSNWNCNKRGSYVGYMSNPINKKSLIRYHTSIRDLYKVDSNTQIGFMRWSDTINEAGYDLNKSIAILIEESR